MSREDLPPAPHTAENMSLPNRGFTLIVATTLDRGIGQNGALPWPTLKNEMAYFSRVTKRPPAYLPQGTRNAVIMGRKTWESIPDRFRPLKGRVNCVISRTMKERGQGLDRIAGTEDAENELVIAGTLEECIHALALRETLPKGEERNEPDADLTASAGIGHVFIIGGASIYASALRMQEAGRILLTKIKKPNFTCDTFFPLDLESDDAKQQGWQRREPHELEAFIGESLGDLGTVRFEGEVEYEFCLYEKAQT